MIYDPDAAASLLDEADRHARKDGSTAMIAEVRAWRLVAEMCRPDGEPERITPADIDEFGGQDTWPWQGNAQAASIAAACGGDLGLALELCDTFSPLPVIPQHWRDGFRMVCTALAGDTGVARGLTSAFAPVATRLSNRMWHAEIVLTLGVLDIREGRTRRGSELIDTARHAPMFMPYFYAVARTYRRRANQSRAATTELDVRPQRTVKEILEELTGSPPPSSPLSPETA